jgi:DNA modification methylase
MNTNATQQQLPVNTILNGNCIEKMRQMPTNSIDFILTDPPYLVNYRDRNGRSIQNDANTDWLRPAMREAYRVLKQDRVAIMFYGWTKVDAFFAAWKDAGFRPVGHLVFRKTYSSKTGFLSYQHEQAYLLAKGRPPLPSRPIAALAPLIRSFTLPGEIVLDPFAGSGSTCATASLCNRRYLGIELDPAYFEQAVNRMARIRERAVK